jgi:predicted nucleotidyltransferase
LPSGISCGGRQAILNALVEQGYSSMGMATHLQRQQVIALTRDHRSTLESFGVKSLFLFGSVARDQAHPGSDADFLVEFSKPVGLFGLSRIRLYLEDLLGCPIDLGTAEALREHLREPVLEAG